jgi:hypothetical protein
MVSSNLLLSKQEDKSLHKKGPMVSSNLLLSKQEDKSLHKKGPRVFSTHIIYTLDL